MIIKQPEDVDHFFKKKLNQLPVDSMEKDWQNLNKLLDQKIISQKSAKFFTGKIIVICISIISIIALLTWWWISSKRESDTIESINTQKNNPSDIMKADSSLRLVPSAGFSPSDKNQKDIKIDKKYNSVKNQSTHYKKDSIENYEKNYHIFW